MSETKKSKKQKKYLFYGLVICIWVSMGFIGITAEPQTEHTIIELNYEPPEDDIRNFEDLPATTQDNFTAAIKAHENSFNSDHPTTRDDLPNDRFILKDNTVYHIKTEETPTDGSSMALIIAIYFIPIMILIVGMSEAPEIDEDKYG